MRDCKNPMMTMNLNAGSRINGRPHNMIGINFPKGLILVINGISFSKDGVAEMLYDWSIGAALAARVFGLFDTIFTLIAIPLMFLIYTTIIVLGIVCWLLLWPFAIYGWSRWLSFKGFMVTVGIFIPCGLLALLASPVILLCTALQIIIPEFTCYVLQLHKWGNDE